ncbi:hypothetical protein V1502_16515 [Bacillus sp. SCS-153A]
MSGDEESLVSKDMNEGVECLVMKNRWCQRAWMRGRNAWTITIGGVKERE